ncbi:MAG TPA: LysE family translocator [Acidimicrobiales bacterium]
MPTPETLGLFALAALALLVVPGPAVIYIVNRSVSQGRAIGLISMLGIQTGAAVHVTFAALGLSAILMSSATAFNAVKYLGAAYLVYLGVRTLLTKPAHLPTALPKVTARRAYAQGVVVNVLNPKTALFFLSFLPQFVDTDRGPVVTQTLVLGAVFILLAMCSDGAYAIAASAVRDVLLRSKTWLRVQRYVSGSVFVGLGLLAAMTGTHRTTASS